MNNILASIVSVVLLVGATVFAFVQSATDDDNALAPLKEDPQITAQAIDCLRARGIDANGTLAFAAAPDGAPEVVYWPILDDGEGNFDTLKALQPLDVDVELSIREREDALQACLEELEAAFGLDRSSEPPPLRLLDSTRQRSIELCLEDHDAFRYIDEIEYLQDADGTIVIEAQHPDMPLEQAREATRPLDECALEVEGGHQDHAHG